MAFVNAAIAVSADGFVAGVNQSLEKPFGEGPVDEITRWMMETPEENREEMALNTTADAFIMGRNMFGPVRGAWDRSWTGWWGDEPPYHAPVFVLTHHAREDLPMAGGTTFHFVTGGPEEALKRAREAAAGQDVRIGGGAETIRHYLKADVINEMHLAIAPILLGRGEPLLDGLDLKAMGFKVVERVPTERALHVVLRKGDQA